MQPLIVADHIVVPADAMEWHAVRARGPGGQNVNKVASKVELRIDPQRIRGLDESQRARLCKRVAAAMTTDGRWIVTSQKTRSQVQNLEDAREKVREQIRSVLVPPRPRIKTRPSRAARQRRLTEKRTASERKERRRWRPEG